MPVRICPSQDDGDKAAAEKQKEFLAKQTNALADLWFTTVDQFTVGWASDSQAGAGHLDSTLTALPGSALAEKLNGLKATTSNYTGFMLKKAAVGVNSSQMLLADDIDQAVQGIDTFQATLAREIEDALDLTDAESQEAAKRRCRRDLPGDQGFDQIGQDRLRRLGGHRRSACDADRGRITSASLPTWKRRSPKTIQTSQVANPTS